MFSRSLLSLTVAMAFVPALALAEPPHNCVGNACNDIDMVWDGGRGGWNVENLSSEKHILFVMSAARGGFGDCPGASQTKRIIRGRTEFFSMPNICRTDANYQ